MTSRPQSATGRTALQETVDRDDILRLILSQVRRPRPAAATMHRWRDLHQHDLTICMRVSSRFHDLAAPLLYATPVVDDLALLLYDSSESGSTLKLRPASTGRLARRKAAADMTEQPKAAIRLSKRDCLGFVGRLYLEIPDAWVKLPVVHDTVIWPHYQSRHYLMLKSYSVHCEMADDHLFQARRMLVTENLYRWKDAFVNLRGIILDAYLHHSTLSLLYFTGATPDDPFDFSIGRPSRSELYLWERNCFLTEMARPDLHYCHHAPITLRPFDRLEPNAPRITINLHQDPIWTRNDSEANMDTEPAYVPDMRNVVRCHPFGSSHIHRHVDPLVNAENLRCDVRGWYNPSGPLIWHRDEVDQLVTSLRPIDAPIGGSTSVIIVPPLPLRCAEAEDSQLEIISVVRPQEAGEEWETRWRAVVTRINTKAKDKGVELNAAIEHSRCPACLDDYDLGPRITKRGIYEDRMKSLWDDIATSEAVSRAESLLSMHTESS